MNNATLIPSRIRPAASLQKRIVAKDEGDWGATDSAFCALTDFELDFPITVDVQASVEDASKDMARLDIHALIVTRRGLRGIEPQVVGLVTAHEIKLAQTVRPESEGQFRTLSVEDAMTPWDELSSVKYESLKNLTAQDLHELFQGTGLTHLLVVEVHDDDVAVARGVLSRATLARRVKQGRHSCNRPSCTPCIGL